MEKGPLEHPQEEDPKRPNEPVDPPMVIVQEIKKRSAWLHNTLIDAEIHVAP